MKMKLVAAVLCAAMVISVSACGSSDTNTEAEESTAGAVESTESGVATVSSLDIEVDALACVTTLADYVGIDVSLTGDYAVTDADVEDIIDSILSSAGIDTREVTDRNTVQEGDLVNVDYTGYLDGEAFDGGTATDTLLEISDDNGYIDGFTDGLIGAEVGTTLDCPVTFPEDYGVDSLNGQEVIFTFTINGIYENVTVDTLSDEDVEENFGDAYDVHTALELWDYVKDYLTNQAISYYVQNYLLENSEVTVPEDYLEACLNEYQESYATSYYGDLDTMEYYMELYGSSLDEWRESYRDYINSSIQLQLIFEVISIKENMEVDEEEFQDYLQSTYLDSSSYSFEDEQDLYESAGDGDSEKGKAYLQKMYLTNQAYNYVIENANVEEG